MNPERLRIEWISAAEGTRFAEIMNDFTEKLRELGPLGKGEGIDEAKLESELEDVAKLVPYIKLVKKDKLAQRLDKARGLRRALHQLTRWTSCSARSSRTTSIRRSVRPA